MADNNDDDDSLIECKVDARALSDYFLVAAREIESSLGHNILLAFGCGVAEHYE